MQNTLLAIALALIAAIVAALVGPWLVDWNAHKPRIEAEASRLFGTPVRIGGNPPNPSAIAAALPRPGPKMLRR